ncbi:MAG: dihydroorotase [Deltaproteobacteria bacterium]|nr:dihydroorotase [Deltaproteobacteria bacterium]
MLPIADNLVLDDVDLRGWANLPPGPCSVLLVGGHFAAVGQHLDMPGAQRVDARGCWLTPGLVDLCAAGREPGQEQDEDLLSLSRCAAAGGYVAVAVGPDTQPSNDDHAVTELIVRRARDIGLCDLLPIGALTHRLQGETLSPMGEMTEAGAVAFGDADRPVRSSRMLRRALEYARSFDRAVFSQPLDLDLAGAGAMHEGPWSTRLGLRGIPAAAEHIAVARDIAVCQLALGRLHLQRLSAARSVDHVRRAKADGIAVTAAVTPWHLLRTDADLRDYDTNLRFAAPLRAEADRQALLAGLRDGTIDAICSDHQPWSVADKEVEFDRAQPGAIGLQTVWPLLCDLVREGDLDDAALVRATMTMPRVILGMPAPMLRIGEPATFALLDPDRPWTLDVHSNQSKSRNTPVWGRPLVGRTLLTVYRGRVTYSD